MEEETVPPQNDLSLDALFDVLADEYRRRLLIALRERNPQRPAEACTRREERRDRTIAIHHTHLPKLEDAGLIEWDRTENVVRRGRGFEEVEPLLELLDDHADELPDEWVV
ncbi:helix-turn-helix domain-containing protein [Natrinema caseinilyticum]|uniref:helix-turn-helix domain-containing protein n=1 Tax=Natrinema caseinilyticum TaxID=2961570 RepID=UPI0020C4B74A|nr:helix-turn-helix domain-containing protein [Natrinema caseinilyticum]